LARQPQPVLSFLKCCTHPKASQDELDDCELEEDENELEDDDIDSELKLEDENELLLEHDENAESQDEELELNDCEELELEDEPRTSSTATSEISSSVLGLPEIILTSRFCNCAAVLCTVSVVELT